MNDSNSIANTSSGNVKSSKNNISVPIELKSNNSLEEILFNTYSEELSKTQKLEEIKNKKVIDKISSYDQSIKNNSSFENVGLDPSKKYLKKDMIDFLKSRGVSSNELKDLKIAEIRELFTKTIEQTLSPHQLKKEAHYMYRSYLLGLSGLETVSQTKYGYEYGIPSLSGLRQQVESDKLIQEDIEECFIEIIEQNPWMSKFCSPTIRLITITSGLIVDRTITNSLKKAGINLDELKKKIMILKQCGKSEEEISIELKNYLSSSINLKE
jgi:hypothetical protein